ncbi:MlaE family lipid ABC transporter permease subunit [Marinibaculum pumilum]|uniref:MlaE family lipid ABC transporter permease subunit n=1 Tax=Marinibaculum pumilum TaxID=1766165 RepID=A0ABV7L974_9PROT
MTEVEASPYMRFARDGDTAVLAPSGDWRVQDAARIDAELGRVQREAGQRLVVDLQRLHSVDTAGAWLIYRTIRDVHAAGGAVDAVNASPGVAQMLQQAARNDRQCEVEPNWENPLLHIVGRVGRATISTGRDARSLIAFVGAVTEAVILSLLRPWRIRWTSLIHNIEQTTLNAVPIISLISFLIGVVLAYQGSQQLLKFGAQIFVVDLIAISVLREIAILLTAIVVAGRSGSAFTAQIGSMNVNEEVDAMRTLGLDPLEVLVLPRLLALVIGMPILAFIADIMGLLGGGLMAWLSLDISPRIFLDRLQSTADFWTVFTGLVKAPVFAVVIAVVGCFEGMRVERNAESVGRRTTVAVVKAIFLVIVIDAAFSIFFGIIGV